MAMNGVCDLELRRLIEGAFLPDRCEVRCGEGTGLSLHFPADAHRSAMTVSDVHLGALPDCRALKDLVLRVRHQRDQQGRFETVSRSVAGR